MEADLSHYHGIDYRDRWRVEHGRRVLTLRMIAVRIRHLPVDSVVATLARDGEPAWELRDLLLAHVWQAAAHSKKPHPLLAKAGRRVEKTTRFTPQRQAALARGRQRAKARQARLNRREA